MEGENVNGRLSMTCIIQDDNSLSRAMVVKTERTDGKRAAAPLVVASYCPFCGEKSKGRNVAADRSTSQ